MAVRWSDWCSGWWRMRWKKWTQAKLKVKHCVTIKGGVSAGPTLLLSDSFSCHWNCEIFWNCADVLCCWGFDSIFDFGGGGRANQQPWEWVKRWSVILLGYRFFFHVVEAQNHYFIFRLPLTVMYLRRNFSRCCCLELDFVSLPITLKCTNVMYIMEYKGCTYIL